MDSPYDPEYLFISLRCWLRFLELEFFALALILILIFFSRSAQWHVHLGVSSSPIFPVCSSTLFGLCCLFWTEGSQSTFQHDEDAGTTSLLREQFGPRCSFHSIRLAAALSTCSCLRYHISWVCFLAWSFIWSSYLTLPRRCPGRTVCYVMLFAATEHRCQ